MKINNSQKGFIVQGIVAIIALTLIAGGAYYAGTKKIEVAEDSHIITSISKSSGSIGDTIEIKGKNLLDRRGDQNLRIMNSKGEDAQLSAEITRENGEIVMTFTLAEKECKEFGSDRGGPCMSDSMLITPGEYDIYVKSVLDNFESNKVKFTVVGNTDSISTSNWKTYSNDKNGYTLRYPSNWQTVENLGVSVQIINPAQKTALGSDQSRDSFTVSFTNTGCEKQEWINDGPNEAYWKRECLNNGNSTIKIELVSLTSESKIIEEKILSTFKFTTPTNTVQNKESVLETPSIKVLSPNGGEVFKNTPPIKITWDYFNLPGADSKNPELVENVHIAVIDKAGKACVVADNIPIIAKGYSINVSSKQGCYPLNPGELKVYLNVRLPVGEAIVEDYSDNYFTITN